MPPENQIEPKSKECPPELVGQVTPEEWDVFLRVRKIAFEFWRQKGAAKRQRGIEARMLKKMLRKQTSSRVKKRAIRLQHLRLAGQILRSQFDPAGHKITSAFQNALVQEPDPDLARKAEEDEAARIARKLAKEASTSSASSGSAFPSSPPPACHPNPSPPVSGESRTATSTDTSGA